MKNNNSVRNNDYAYLIVILCFVLPFIFYYWSLNRNNNEERFQTEQGCYWSYPEGPCVCSKFTPSLLNISNDKCERDCGSFKDNLQCLGEENIAPKKEDQKYWCQKDGKCFGRYIDVHHSAANECGYNEQAEGLNPKYLTKSLCEKNLDKCEIHNNDKKKCLKQKDCGWCTDGKGKGKCVDGTPSGPYNPNYKCRPDTGKTNFAYTPGLPNQFF